MQNKLISISMAFLLINTGLMAQSIPPAEYQRIYREKMDRTRWWRDARFGMFIHFGVYAVPARGEWVQSNERIPAEEYRKYVDAFLPEAYDASEWARIAKEAGMKYAVMTAKHHDGFCLFDSKYTDYDIGDIMPGRDLVREFLDAFRAEGLQVGLYYSLIDWHHPDYPNVGNHPMRDNAEWSKKKYNWDNYLKYMHAQVEELLTGYGKLDILWFDYSFDDYSGEKWKASELVKMVRDRQSHIIIDSRLEVNPGVKTAGRDFSGYGDFETPEQGIPDAGIVDRFGQPIPWETCLTLNNNWGYHAGDHHWKSPQQVVHALVNCVSKDGNLLLNVGPDATGRIPEPSVEILSEVGKWMTKNGESIYGCGSSELAKPEWGRLTQRGNTIYAHWMYPMIGHINLPGISSRVKSVSLVPDGAELPTSRAWWGNEQEGNFFINVARPTYHTFTLPDALDTVIRIELMP